MLQAAIELSDEATAADRARFYAFARRGRPQARREVGRRVDLRHRGQTYSFRVHQLGPERYRVTVDGSTVELDVEHLGEYERRLALREESCRTAISRQGDDLLVEVDGLPHRISHDEGGAVRSPAPGVVVSVLVAVGDEVEAATSSPCWRA